MLGEEKEPYTPAEGSESERVNARHDQLPVRNNLSSHGKVIVCQFLQNEARLYVDLLNRAVNLSDDDVREAIIDVQTSCPIESIRQR